MACQDLATGWLRGATGMVCKLYAWRDGWQIVSADLDLPDVQRLTLGSLDGDQRADLVTVVGQGRFTGANGTRTSLSVAASLLGPVAWKSPWGTMLIKISAENCWRCPGRPPLCTGVSTNPRIKHSCSCRTREEQIMFRWVCSETLF